MKSCDSVWTQVSLTHQKSLQDQFSHIWLNFSWQLNNYIRLDTYVPILLWSTSKILRRTKIMVIEQRLTPDVLCSVHLKSVSYWNIRLFIRGKSKLLISWLFELSTRHIDFRCWVTGFNSSIQRQFLKQFNLFWTLNCLLH